MRLDHLLSKELLFVCPQLWVIVCVVESPSVRLPRKYFCRVETHLQGHGGIVWMVVRLACEGVVRRVVPGGWMHPVCVTKEYALVHCWVSGAAQGCSCWALMSAGCLCVVGCVWGLCCVRTV